ncbi:MAG: hypothetical protein ACP5RT_01880 [Candidatus Micrarchaeia archaeon]
MNLFFNLFACKKINLYMFLLINFSKRMMSQVLNMAKKEEDDEEETDEGEEGGGEEEEGDYPPEEDEFSPDPDDE